MDTCNTVDNTVGEQVSFLFAIIILIGMMIATVYILLNRHFMACGTTSTEECAKVRGVLVISSEFPSPPMQQKSTDKGELVL